MNNVFAFSNAEEFKELFGMRTMANGEKVRKNKILLGFLKDFNFHKYVRSNYPRTAKELFRIKDVADLYTTLNDLVAKTSRGQWYISLFGYGFNSEEYRLDNRQGVCQDHDFSKVRVVYNDGSVKKIKAGKLYKSLIMSSEFGRNLPESTVLYLCEEFTRRWEVWAETHVPKEDNLCESLELHVDDNFHDIYSTDCCCERFSYSCMFDNDQYYFYENAVDAKAAYLTDKDDVIVARCVIFTNVHEVGSNRIWRMAERQYAIRLDGDGDAGNEHMKRVFIDKLIKAGYIDCYKKIGAACSEATAILDADGNSLSHKEFYIPCYLEDGDTLSYQDTFKFYLPDEGRAYNTPWMDNYVNLDTTSSEVGIPWDDYHDRYCASTVEAHYDGRWINVDIDDLDDFVDIHGEYRHKDEVIKCPHCGEMFLEEDDYYSELTWESYCCEGCRDDAEKVYAAEHKLVFDTVNGEWISDDNAVRRYSVKPRIWLESTTVLDCISKDAAADMTEEHDTIGDILVMRDPLPFEQWPHSTGFRNAVNEMWAGKDFSVTVNGKVYHVHAGEPSFGTIFGFEL